MKKAIIIFFSVILCLAVSWYQDFTRALAQQEAKDNSDPSTIESLRKQMLKRWGGKGLGDSKKLETKARTLLAKPIESQTFVELEAMAEEANKIANLVGYIFEEYSDYYRENYSNKRIQYKVRPYHNAHLRVANKFKGYRNQAFFNLGMKSKVAGNSIAAFFYFRDAFRLSNFVDSSAPGGKGVRYKAEIEMKAILGLQDLDTFITGE